MDDERQQKVLAGKEKLAEFLQKRNRQGDKHKKKKNSGSESSSAVTKYLDQSASSVGVEELDEQGPCQHSQSVELSNDQKLQISHSLPDENRTNSSEASGAEQEYCAQIFADSVEEASLLSDSKATFQEYNKKLQEYKLALQQRDAVITQLSERLVVTLSNRDQVQTEAFTQAENLEKEISVLKLQLQQASDVLGKQKSQNGISASELLEAQNQNIWLAQENERKDLVIKDLCMKLNDANRELEKLQIDFNLEVNECEHRLRSLESELQKEGVGFIEDEANFSNLGGIQNSEIISNSVEVQTEYEYFVVDILRLQLDVERMKRTLKSIKDLGLAANEDSKSFQDREQSEECVNPSSLEMQISELKNLLNTYNKEMCLTKWNCVQDMDVFNKFVSNVELRLSAITEAGVVLMTSDSEVSKLKAENKDLCFAVNQLNELVDKLTAENIQIQDDPNFLRNLTSSPIERSDGEDHNIKFRSEVDTRFIDNFENRTAKFDLKLLVREKNVLKTELDSLRGFHEELAHIREDINVANRVMNDLNVSVLHLKNVEQELEMTSAELLEKTAFCNKAEKEISELRQKQEELLSTCESCRDEINCLKTENMLVSADIQNSLTEELAVVKLNNENLKTFINKLQEEKELALKELEMITEKHENEVQEKELLLQRQLEDEQSCYEAKLNKAKLHFENVILELMSKCTQLENDKRCLESDWKEKYQILVEKICQMELELSVASTNSVRRSQYEDVLQQLRCLQNVEGKLKMLQDEKEALYGDQLLLKQEIEKLKSSAVTLENERSDIEQALSMKIVNLSNLQIDISAQLDEAKTDLEFTRSRKIKLEEEVKLLKQQALQRFETPDQKASFELQSVYNIHIVELQDRLDLASEERNELQKQLAFIKKKSCMQEFFQTDLVNQLKKMKEQLKVSSFEQQGFCRDLACLAEKKQKLEVEVKQLKETLEERVSNEESKNIAIHKVTPLGVLDDELDIEHSYNESSEAWEVSEKSDLVVDCCSEERDRQTSLESEAAALSDQKMVFLLESSQQFVHDKEALEKHVVQVGKMITDIGIFLEQQLHNLTVDNTRQWIDELEVHRDKLLEELNCLQQVSQNLTGWLANNSTMEETLKQQKEFLLEKVQEKERLEEDVVHLRKAVERCEHVMKTLEEKLAQRHAVEQELSRHNQLLESELHDIEVKLREKEESLASQKIQLQSEIKWKDLELKAKELDLQQKMLELENREQQVVIDKADNRLQLSKELKAKEWDRMQELRHRMEQYHSVVVSSMQLQLKREHEAAVLKLQEEHAAECAAIRQLHQQQINDLINKMTENVNASCEDDHQKLEKEWLEKMACLEKVHCENMERIRLELQVVQSKLLLEQRFKVEEEVRVQFGYELQSLKAENAILVNECRSRPSDIKESENVLSQLVLHLDTKCSEHIQGMTKMWKEIYLDYLSDLHSQLSLCFKEVSVGSHSLPLIEQEANELIKKREIILQEASVMNNYILSHYEELVTLREKLEENAKNAIEILCSNIELKEGELATRETQTQLEETNGLEEYKTLLDAVICEKDYTHSKDMESLSEKLKYEATQGIKEIKREHEQLAEEIRKKCLEEASQTWLLKLEEISSEHMEDIQILNEKFDEEKNVLCLENVEKVKKLINKQNLEIEEICANFDRERERNKQEWAYKEEQLLAQLENYQSFQKDTENENEKQVHELERIISDLSENHQEELASYKKCVEELLQKISQLESKLFTLSDLQLRIDKLAQDNNDLLNDVEKLKLEREEVEFGFQQQIYDLIEDHSKEVKYEKEQANLLVQQAEKQREEIVKKLEAKHNEEVSKLSKELINLHSVCAQCSSVDPNCNTRVSMKELEEFRGKLEANFCQERTDMSLAHQRELDEMTAKYEKEQEILRLSVSELQGELQKIAEATLETVPAATSFDDVFENIFSQIEQLMSEIYSSEAQNIQYFTNEKMFCMKEVLKTQVEKYVSAQLMLQSECIDDVYEEPRYDTFYRDLQPIQELDELEYGMDDVDPQLISIQKNPSVGTDTDDLPLQLDAEVENLKKIIQQNILNQQSESDQVAQEVNSLKEQICKVEEYNLSLEAELAKCKDEQPLQSKKPRDGRHAAQTNSRLMHVLSDLVKTFVDTEQSIQQKLYSLGLQLSDAGLIQEDDNGPPSGHFHGSREDFTTFSQGEGPSLELCDDDLTPRAWDRFAAAIGSQDLEAEGEDILLGASRRLRGTVEHVLTLLSDLVESQQNLELGDQLQKNDNLLKSAKEEAQTNEHLQMKLLRAEGTVKSLDQEKHALEDKLVALEKKLNQQGRDLLSFQKQMSRLEEQNESLSGKNSLLEQQNATISSNFHDSEIKNLLEEQIRLGQDQLNQKQQNERERQRLLTRIHQLEVTLEEVSSQKEEMLDEKTKEIEDLKAQMEAMEKQLLSNKKFINEQAHDREQEREEVTREISKLRLSVKEKERNQAVEKQLAKEIENLEQQMKSQATVLQEVTTCRNTLENDLKNSSDKISDLQDVIGELESQLDVKAKIERELQEHVSTLKSALTQQEESCGELHQEQDEARPDVNGLELVERVQLLESQLDSRDQRLEQLSQCQNLLQEFRGQIRILNEKVESKIRYLSRGKLRAVTSSPVSSEDTSTSDSKEQDSHLMIQEGRVLSPSSLHWEEIKRFENKIDILLLAYDDLQRRCLDLEIQLRKAKCCEEELCTEKDILQQQLSEHLLQISSLRTHIEAKRYDTRRSKVAAAVMEELNQVKELMLREQTQRDKAERLLKESTEKISEVQEHLTRERARVFELELQYDEIRQECQNIRDERDDLKGLAAASVNKMPSVERKDFAVQTSFFESLREESTSEKQCKVLEDELQRVTEVLSKERESGSRQISTLLREIENLNLYQAGDRMAGDATVSCSKIRKNLENDFDSLHELYKERVDELEGIETEVNNQLDLEKTVNRLKLDLIEERKKCAAYMAEAEELRERVRLLNEENCSLQQLQGISGSDGSPEKLGTDSEELKTKVADLICEETQKQVSKANERHKQELEAAIFSISQKYQEEAEKIQQLLNEESDKVQTLLQEDIHWKAKCKHLEEMCTSIEVECKSKIDILLADSKEKLEKASHCSDLRAKELEQTLGLRYQEELNAIRSSWFSDKEEMGKEQRELITKHEAEIIELQACHKAEYQELSDLHDRQMSAARAQAAEQLQTVRASWSEEKTLMTRKHEAQLLELESRYKSEYLALEALCDHRVKLLEEEKESLEKKNRKKDLEATYQDQVKNIQDMLHRFKVQSTILSRESTPDSDATSSSVATSTGDEQEALPRPIKKLFDKVLKEGIEVLSLTECQQLRDHLTPEKAIQESIKVQNMDVWQLEKEIILQQITTLANMTLHEPLIEREKLFQDLFTIICKEKDKISMELKMFAEHPLSFFGVENFEEKLHQLESHVHTYGKMLNDGLANSKLTLDRELTKNQQLEQQVFFLKEQVAKSTWQIRTQKEMLDFRLKQEKSQICELQIALDSEKVHNSQLQSQLQQQRSICTELQMAVSSAKAEVTRLQYLCGQVKKEAENNKNLYDVEKSHTLSLMKALEMERASFTQVQMTLESERRQNKSLHSQSQHVIQELRACVARHAGSSTLELMSPPELLRSETTCSSRSLDLVIPSLTFGDSSFLNLNKCPKCVTLKATLDTERIAWANQEAALTKSLAILEGQLSQKPKEVLECTEPMAGRSKILNLYFKYRRSEHHRQSLVNQKKYLFKLLRGYEMTESAALHVLSRMGMCTPQDSTYNYSPSSDTPKHSRFRAAIYTVVAILRMKYLVRRTKKTFHLADTLVGEEARLSSPSSQYGSAWRATTKNENSPVQSSNSSLSSSTTSVPGFIIQPFSQMGSSSRRSNATSISSRRNETKGSKLSECVSRLSHLHKTLGLDDST